MWATMTLAFIDFISELRRDKTFYKSILDCSGYDKGVLTTNETFAIFWTYCKYILNTHTHTHIKILSDLEGSVKGHLVTASASRWFPKSRRDLFLSCYISDTQWAEVFTSCRVGRVKVKNRNKFRWSPGKTWTGCWNSGYVAKIELRACQARLPGQEKEITNWSVESVKSPSVGKSVIQASRSFQRSLTRELGAVGNQSRQVSVNDILQWWWWWWNFSTKLKGTVFWTLPTHTLSVSTGPGLELCEDYKDGKLLWCLGAAEVAFPHWIQTIDISKMIETEHKGAQCSLDPIYLGRERFLLGMGSAESWGHLVYSQLWIRVPGKQYFW